MRVLFLCILEEAEGGLGGVGAVAPGQWAVEESLGTEHRASAAKGTAMLWFRVGKRRRGASWRVVAV